jgi:hypothetical protein
MLKVIDPDKIISADVISLEEVSNLKSMLITIDDKGGVGIVYETPEAYEVTPIYGLGHSILNYGRHYNSRLKLLLKELIESGWSIHAFTRDYAGMQEAFSFIKEKLFAAK